MTISYSGQQIVIHGTKSEIAALSPNTIGVEGLSDDTHELGFWTGSAWIWMGAGGTGTVLDTGATAPNHLAIWNGSSDHTIKDGGVVPSTTGMVTGPGSSTDGHVALFDGTTGKVIKDGGALAGGGNVSDTGSTTADHLAVWNGSNDHIIKDGGVVPSAGIARSGSTTDAHLAVWNGSNADSIKDGGAAPSAPVYPSQIILPLIFPSANSGAAYGLDTGQYYNFRTLMGTQSSYLDFLVLLQAGTWRLDILGENGTNRGIITVEIDSSNIGTIDQYGSGDNNHTYAITGITIATTGVKTVRLSNPTKNGSSSGYYITITEVVFTKTA